MFGIFGKKQKKEEPQVAQVEKLPQEYVEPTVEHNTEPEKVVEETFTDLLTKNGLKVTAARMAVLETLKKADKPVDSQYLIDELSETLGVDRVTIFRIVNALTEKDIIRKLEFREGKSRYELNTKDHHHIICEKCGKIEDVLGCGVKELEEEIGKKTGYIVKRHSLEFYGLCSDCQNK